MAGGGGGGPGGKQLEVTQVLLFVLGDVYMHPHTLQKTHSSLRNFGSHKAQKNEQTHPRKKS